MDHFPFASFRFRPQPLLEVPSWNRPHPLLSRALSQNPGQETLFCNVYALTTFVKLLRSWVPGMVSGPWGLVGAGAEGFHGLEGC